MAARKKRLHPKFFFSTFVVPMIGELSEWLKEPASKTGVRQRTGGSNPSLTAVTLDYQAIKHFTHILTHIEAKFVRIFFVFYRREL